METRSKLDTSGIDFSQYTMPSPRRKGTGSGPPPATTTGPPSTGPPSTPTTSAVSPPEFTAEYNLELVSDLLIRAGLEPPITTQLPQEHNSRMSVKCMRHLRLPQQWVSAEAHMLSDASICSPLESAMLLSVMCFGLGNLSLITSEDRYLTVGGPPIQTQQELVDLRSAFARAVQCPGIPAGSPALHYIPTREDFINFIRELCPWIATIDPELSKLVREVADTHGPDREKIIEWDTRLGPAGKSQLYSILVTKASMPHGLQKFFSAGIGDDPCGGNGLAMLQVLCAATLQFTLHTVDISIQNFINVSPCPSAQDLHKYLLAHEQRLLVLKQLKAIGGGVTMRFLEIGTLKRLCEKVEPAMRIINEMELEEGTELSLSNVKAALAAYAEKTFRDWQVDKAIKVNAATITASMAASITVPTLSKKAKAAAARALPVAAVVAAPAAATIPTPMGNCSSWLFVGHCRHHLTGTCVRDHPPAHMGVFKKDCYTTNSLGVSVQVCWNFARKGFCHNQTAGTCNKEHIDIPLCRAPPGKFPSRALRLINSPINPIILNPKCARDMSRKSPTKSLTPNIVNPNSIPILHTPAPSPVVPTSTPTPALIAGGIRGPDRQGENIIVGALISDTGAETCIWGKEVQPRLYDIQPLSEPVRFQVASGAHIYVHERAKMRVGKVVLEGYVMPDSPLSLISDCR